MIKRIHKIWWVASKIKSKDDLQKMLPHLTRALLNFRTLTLRPSLLQGWKQHTSNTPKKTSTQHIIDSIRVSSIMVAILKGRWEMIKDYRTFEWGRIKKLLVKLHRTKTKGVSNNSSKEAIKEMIQWDKDWEIIKIKESTDNKIVLYQISFF